MGFSDRFKELFDETGLKKVALAPLLGMQTSQLSYILNYGVTPKISTVVKIADYFRKSMDYVLDLPDSNDSEFIPIKEYISDYKTIVDNFLLRFEAVRNFRGFSYYALETAIHAGHSYFASTKRLRQLPESEYMVNIAESLDVSIDFLIGRSNNAPNEVLLALGIDPMKQ